MIPVRTPHSYTSSCDRSPDVAIDRMIGKIDTGGNQRPIRPDAMIPVRTPNANTSLCDRSPDVAIDRMKGKTDTEVSGGFVRSMACYGDVIMRSIVHYQTSTLPLKLDRGSFLSQAWKEDVQTEQKGGF
jgi:hypothetical protein